VSRTESKRLLFFVPTGLLMLAMAVSCGHKLTPIPQEPGLAIALDQLVEAERTQDRHRLYSLAAPEFAGPREEEFVPVSAHGLSLVSWRFVQVRPALEGVSRWVLVVGCGCYKEGNRFDAYVTGTVAAMTDKGWRFDGISVFDVVDAKPSRCRTRDLPHGPCAAEDRSGKRGVGELTRDPRGSLR
jgi:hypothetical protein